jgi:hypothetical protein
MHKKDETSTDRIERALFLSKDEANKLLSPREYRVMKRWMAIHSFMLTNPSATDKQTVDFITTHDDEEVRAEYVTVYNDIKKVSAILGKINDISREWNKYVIVQINKEQIQLARENIDTIRDRATHDGKILLSVDDHKNIAAYIKVINKCTDTIGKYLQLDKEQVDKLIWEELKPADFETTTDVKVIEGFNQNMDEIKKDKLRREFLDDNVSDAIEVS